MTKRGLILLITAVLVIGLGAAAIASSIGGSADEPATHTMPSGQTMDGDRMDPGTAMPSGDHEMPNGDSMDGMSMGG